MKSPVREDCTPGSVRGRPGNGPPYREGQTKKGAAGKRMKELLR